MKYTEWSTFEGLLTVETHLSHPTIEHKLEQPTKTFTAFSKKRKFIIINYSFSLSNTIIVLK